METFQTCKLRCTNFQCKHGFTVQARYTFEWSYTSGCQNDYTIPLKIMQHRLIPQAYHCLSSIILIIFANIRHLVQNMTSQQVLYSSSDYTAVILTILLTTCIPGLPNPPNFRTFRCNRPSGMGREAPVTIKGSQCQFASVNADAIEPWLVVITILIWNVTSCSGTTIGWQSQEVKLNWCMPGRRP